MQLDANLILRSRQPEDPLQTIQQLSTLKQLANKDRTMQMEAEKQQQMQSLLQKNIKQDASGKMGVDYESASQQAFMGGNVDAGLALQKQFEQHGLEKMEHGAKAMKMLLQTGSPEAWDQIRQQAIRLQIPNAEKLPLKVESQEQYNSILARALDIDKQLNLVKEQQKAALDQQKFEFDKQKHRDDLNLDYAKLNDSKKTAQKQGSKTQFDAAGFGRRLEGAEKIFKNLTDAGYDRTSIDSGLGASSFYPNSFRSEDKMGNKFGVQNDQAERNFINATLRRESGAAISPDEFKSAEMQYFPRVGDDKQTLANKAANRRQVIETMKAEAGESWEKVPLVEAENVNLDKGFLGQFGLDVLDYATKHKISPAAAQAIKDQRSQKAGL